MNSLKLTFQVKSNVVVVSLSFVWKVDLICGSNWKSIKWTQVKK